MSRTSFTKGGGLAFAVLALFAGTASAQQAARLTGRVTSAGNGEGLQGVRVTITGTSLITGTTAEGRYTFISVPAGNYEVRVILIGFEAGKKSFTATLGQETTVDFALSPAAIQLEAVVTTATGEQRKLEIGNSVATIDAAAAVQSTPITGMSDLLVAKAPGVQLLGGNLTGAGQRIRIRGTNSLSLNNEPIVVIDGVRVTSDNNSASMGIGGTNPSRLNDINPDEIETIEIVKGPSAATLYGTDAANGVIVIRTKRGKAGSAKWNLYGEQGIVEDRNTYPTAYRGWRTGSTPSNATQCFLRDVALGTCVQDSVSRYNLWDDPEATPLNRGNRQQYGAQVSGGSEVARYFVGGEWENEIGYLTMPKFALERLLASRGTGPRPEQKDPNAYRRGSFRANVSANLSNEMDVNVTTNYINSEQRLPQTDNNTTGLLSNGFGGPGHKDNGRFGYRAFTPDEFFSETVRQKINRWIGGTTANWRPQSWLSSRATLGLDYTSRNESDLCRRDECVNFGTNKTGFKGNNRSEFFNYTADIGATGTFRLTEALESKTTVGAQFTRRLFQRNGAFGENLPPGSSQAGDGAIPGVEELADESKTLGAFVEEQFGWRDRLFVTAALRADDNSAFGKDYSAVYYPKASVSWILSDESFFPKVSLVNSFRVRSAWGASGTQPGQTDALRFFAPTTTAENGVDVPSLVFSALGNDDLKPERATEVEAGFDLGMFDSRVSVEFSYFNKLTEDALVARRIAPSAGASTTRFENIGSVRNQGIELGINARLIDRTNFGWDVVLNHATTKNRLEDLGGTPPIVGATTRQVEGYPIDGYWQRKIRSYADANGDGIISQSEVVVDAEASYVGPSVPVHEQSLITGVDFLKRKVRVQFMFDRKAGHYLLNGTERIRCESRNNCLGLIDRTASFFDQARAIAVRFDPSRTQAGYMEKADFIRLREISATVTAPDRWAHLVRASTMSLSLGARNVALWTDYTGIDPESNYFAGARGTVSDFQTAPPPSYFTMRLNLGF